MARKKSKDAEWTVDKVDGYLEQIWEIASDHYGKSTVLDGAQADDRIVGLPVPSLALRYLLQNSVWPLQRIVQLTGLPGCGKSTLLDDIMRWHRRFGGRGVLMEAEDKDNADQRRAVLNYDDRAVIVRPCEVLEDWQEGLSFFLKKFHRLFDGTATDPGPGRIAPVCFGVDSTTGKACRESVDKMRKLGYATREFAIEANLISRYMKYVPQLVVNYPFSVVGVTHWKPSSEKTGPGGPTGQSAGGLAPKFQETLEIRLSKVRSFTRASYAGYTVQLRTDKNSLGPDKKSIIVDVVWWYEPYECVDENGVTQRGQRQHTVWDWEAASISTLLGFAKQGKLFRRLMDVCDLHLDSRKAGRVWSNALGVPSSDTVSFRDAGVLLEGRPDLLVPLYQLLGIHERKPFVPGVCYLKQMASPMSLDERRQRTHAITAVVSEPRHHTKAAGSDEEEVGGDD